MLHKANCSHCGHRYGQFPVFPYLIYVDILMALLLVLMFAFQSAVLFGITIPVVILDLFLHLSMAYTKLNDNGTPIEENSDLYCKMEILEKYGKIKRYELYFLNEGIDDFEPFALASPIQVYSASKKSNIILGEFSYIHEKNYDYMVKECCDLYDAEMNLIAKVKFMADENTAK